MVNHTEAVLDRAKGCLIGALVGDALGAAYEFQSPEIVQEKVAKQLDKSMLAMEGGGAYSVKAGQLTSDGELTMTLARAMLKHGTYDPANICSWYVDWFQSPGFGMGRTIGNAFWEVAKKETPQKRLKQVVRNSRKLNSSRQSNVSLARTAALGIAGVNWSEEIVKATAEYDASLTNPNAPSKDATAAYVASLRTGIRLGSPEDAYATACRVANVASVRAHLDTARDGPEPITLPSGEHVHSFSANMGYLGVALQNAYFELMNTTKFETAMWNIAMRGGDTNTNMCIAGALLGSVHGVSSIPLSWIEEIMCAKVEQRLTQFPAVSAKDCDQVAEALLSVMQPKKSAFGKII